MKRGIDYIGVGVGALIVDAQGRLFLAKRGPKAKNERGLWEFPGGGVEFGETLAAALRREIHEEYGIWITVGELLDVVDHLLPDEGQHWVSPTFLCTLERGEPQIREPEKCSAIGWFLPHEMPTELTQITRENFRHYCDRLAAGAMAHTPSEHRSLPPEDTTPTPA
ncbi:MAG: NUDIX domain-containing protein [Caldilineaceae bacterium]